MVKMFSKISSLRFRLQCKLTDVELPGIDKPEEENAEKLVLHPKRSATSLKTPLKEHKETHNYFKIQHSRRLIPSPRLLWEKSVRLRLGVSASGFELKGCSASAKLITSTVARLGSFPPSPRSVKFDPKKWKTLAKHHKIWHRRMKLATAKFNSRYFGYTLKMRVRLLENKDSSWITAKQWC